MSDQNKIPTEEQLFDYHLGLLSPAEIRLVESHLKAHPEDLRKWNEMKSIVSSFASFPLKSPSDQCLKAVEDMAARLQKPSFGHVLRQYFSFKQTLSWSLLLVLVFGAGLIWQNVRLSDALSVSSKSPITDEKTNNAVIVPMTPSKNSQENLLSQKFSDAQNAFNAGHFERAQQILVEIQSEDQDGLSTQVQSLWLKTQEALQVKSDVKANGQPLSE